MKPWFTITNKANEPTKIMLYGVIGGGYDGEPGVDAKEFVTALDEIPKNQKIDLHVHSPGGSVFESLPMYNKIDERRQYVTAYVDGVALSAASFIAMAAGKVVMPRNSRMMIHDAQGLVMGDSSKMKGMAALLDRESDNIAAMYARKTGKPANQFRDLMRATTWFNGEEAKALGLADEVTEASAVRNDFDLSHFKNVPNEVLNISAPVQGADKQNKPPESMKETLTALLNKWGVTIPENATDEQLTDLVAKGKPTTTANNETPKNEGDTKTITALGNQLTAITAQLAAEKKERITNAFNAIAATRPHLSENREAFLNRCLADETILNDLKAFPETALPANTGHLPRVTGGGNSTIDAFNALQPGEKRRDWLRNNHLGLRNAMASAYRLDIRNDNTIDSALVTAHLADGLVVVMQNKLAMLNVFTRDFSADPIKPLATVQIRKAVSGASSAQDPTSFEGGDSNLDNIAVTMHQEGHPFHINNSDRLNGVRLEHLAAVNAAAFANTLTDRVTAAMVVGSYGAALVIGSAANFDADDLSPILAVAKNYPTKNLILDGGHLAFITPKTTDQINWQTNGAFGFDTIVPNNRWSGSATANLVGFVTGPDSIAVASGTAADLPGGEYDSITNTPLANGVTVRTAIHWIKATRKWQVYHDIMWGVAAGDTTQAELLVTA